MMALQSIENKKPTQSSVSKPEVSPRRQRIISESTGLVKFNITRKVFEQKEKANREFANLEQQVQEATATATTTTTTTSNKPKVHHIAHQASYIQLSPQRPEYPTSSHAYGKEERSLGLLDESLMLELAGKQREVLELKSNIEEMKKRLQSAERELSRIEQKCNRSTHHPPSLLSSNYISNKEAPPTVPPRRHHGKPLDQFTSSLRSKPSIQILKSSIENHTAQTNNNISNLKKRMSIPQLKSRTSLLELSKNINTTTMNENFQKLTKDTNIMIERGLSFVNNLKIEMFKEEEFDDSDYSDAESDYGCADASNYQLAVK